MPKDIKIIKSEKDNYTEEQRLIINQKYKRGDIIRVNAGPGVGKSFSLKEFSKKRQKRRILYLAFNKSIQTEASKKFPRNVTVKTSHSLAYKKYGFSLQHKLSFSDLKPLMISNYFNIGNNFKAMLAYELVKGFIHSKDFEISIDHLPENLKSFIEKKNISSEEIFDYSVKLWDCMINPNNEDIQCTHDTYLKLYQLSKPRLDYDYILIDECQDTDLCVFDIIMRQERAVKVFVGDENQSLYSWRGAKNSMNFIQPDYDFNLTKSFRFKQDIADMANQIIKLKNAKIKIKGNEKVEESQCKNIAYIARTNSGVFSMAIETPGKLYFVGGLQGYTFNKIFDAYYLWTNEKHKIKNPFVKEFEDFSEYIEYGEEVMDVEVMSTSRLIRNYGRRLPGLLFDIKNRTTKKEKEADLILTTAHKAKGSEWDQVLIAEDYYPIFDESGEELNQDLIKNHEEINLFYVTITRAKTDISLNKELFKFFNIFNKKKECLI